MAGPRVAATAYSPAVAESHEAGQAAGNFPPRKPTLQPPSWATLMMAAQDGDGEAFGALLRAVTPMIRSLAQHYCEAHEDAERVVQHALLSVHSLRATYRPSQPFLRWLAAIAAQRTIEWLQQPARRGVGLRTATGAAAERTTEPELLLYMTARQRRLLRRWEPSAHALGSEIARGEAPRPARYQVGVGTPMARPHE